VLEHDWRSAFLASVYWRLVHVMWAIWYHRIVRFPRINATMIRVCEKPPPRNFILNFVVLEPVPGRIDLGDQRDERNLNRCNASRRFIERSGHSGLLLWLGDRRHVGASDYLSGVTAWAHDGRTLVRLPTETHTTLAIDIVHPRRHFQFVQTITLVVDLHAYYLSFAGGGTSQGRRVTQRRTATVAGTSRIVIGTAFVTLAFLPQIFVFWQPFERSGLVFHRKLYVHIVNSCGDVD